MVFPLLRQFAGVMEWWSIAKYQIPSTRFQGFSVPAFASRASARQAVFPAAASLQTGFPLRSNTFQLLCFFFLTPDTRHLKPPKQLAIFTGKAIEFLPGPKREVFDSEVKPVPA